MTSRRDHVWNRAAWATSLALACAGPAQLENPSYADDAAAKAAAPAAAEAAGWKLVFTDRFDRPALGAAWEPLHGTWTIADGMLQGKGVLISRGSFPARDKTGLVYAGGFALGFIRMEFVLTPGEGATADPLGGVPEWERVGLGCFINGRREENAEQRRVEPGYTFQFGGLGDDAWKILKRGGQVVASADEAGVVLTPGKRHQCVVENDQGRLRFIVDDTVVLDQKEMFSIMGSGYDRVGFCLVRSCRIDDVNVYVKRLPGGMDRDELLEQ